jgi:hypothetical protein
MSKTRLPLFSLYSKHVPFYLNYYIEYRGEFALTIQRQQCGQTQLSGEHNGGQDRGHRFGPEFSRLSPLSWLSAAIYHALWNQM